MTPRKYGLKTVEVLSQSDKELNQLVGLKKLATYRDDSKDKWRYNKSAMRAQREVFWPPAKPSDTMLGSLTLQEVSEYALAAL